jgi:Mce-associated membrane protein
VTADVDTGKPLPGDDLDDAGTSTEVVESTETESPAAPDRRGVLRRALGRWRIVVPTVAVVAAAGTAGYAYLTQYRVDVATDPAATAEVIQAATDGTIAVLTYKPDTIDADLAAAQSHLTGEFLTYYTEFGNDILKPATRDREVTTEAAVVGAADTEIGPDAATVLVFVNQQTVSRDRPEPAQSASSVLVDLTKVDGRWLISAFEPI